jgi:hypothetical protein
MKYIKLFEEFLNESTDYAVMLTGGSLGETPRPRDARGYVGMDVDKDQFLLTLDNAKAKAKRMNANLSPGERKHYGLKYVVVPVKGGKFIKESLELNEVAGLYTASDVIGNPIEIGNIEVAERDLTELNGADLKLVNANRLAKKMGKGWRLPTRDELTEMYKNVNSLPNIKKNAFYMSSETFGSKAVWVQSFGTGKQEYFTDGGQAYSVRLVKTA